MAVAIMNKVYAIDFDGTLCENDYPNIGEPIQKVIDFVKDIKDKDNKIILWTCRVDDRLDEAIEWCKEQGIEFDAVNENLPENIDLYGGDTRKINADYYIDDKVITIDDIVNEDVEVRTITREEVQTRSLNTKLTTRAENEDIVIEGYFVTFNQQTELWPGAYEEIAPQSMDKTLSNDIRALINHDTTLVLGRNKSGTLELKTDTRGLWGSVKINPNDSDAVNLYERVKRGDVSQCSFGFNVLGEETEWRDDGSVKWTITEIDLHEVSVCTFPAYEETGVQARHNQIEQHRAKQLEQKKHNLKERLKGYGNKTINDK
jgi:HK97 family phage prohead protease